MKAIVSVAGLLCAAPLLLAAFQEGPLPGYTGGFGEPTCHHCHFDNRLNDPDGSLRVTGVPASYSPGTEYDLTITLSRSGARRGGFQLAARFADGTQAGGLRASSAGVKVIASADGKVQYVTHAEDASNVDADGSRDWSIVWTAPKSADGPVAIHVAANAGNDDASPLGDFVYTAVFESGGRPEGRPLRQNADLRSGGRREGRPCVRTRIFVGADL